MKKIINLKAITTAEWLGGAAQDARLNYSAGIESKASVEVHR
jgi:hypothetical protein